MKKLCILLIPLLTVNLLLAQVQSEETNWKAKTKVGLRGSGNLFVAPMAENHVGGIWDAGIGGYIDYKLSKRFTLNLSLDYHKVRVDYTQILKSHIHYLALRAKYFLLPDAGIKPYLGAGLGPFSFTQVNGLPDRYYDGIATVGLGAEIPLSERFDLVPEINYNLSNSPDLDRSGSSGGDYGGRDTYLNVTLGLAFTLGSAEKEEPPAPEEEEVEEEVEKPEEVEEEPEEEPEEPEEEEEEAEELDEAEKEEIEKKYYEKLQYMIKPNDYLVKIAGNMYEDKEMWRDIYSWNRDMIGDNPNLIYPFHELLLKDVPVDNANKLEYEYYNYEVEQNESLWKIAAKEYDNPYAWIIIYKDNKDILEKNAQKIEPGTILKLRSELFNK